MRIIDAANLGLLPVYGVKKGLSQETAALMLTAFIVGNIVLQFPIGWIADHWSKRGMMSICAIVTAIGSALSPWAFGSWFIWPVLVVTGAASAGIYTLALAELGERFSGHRAGRGHGGLLDHVGRCCLCRRAARRLGHRAASGRMACPMRSPPYLWGLLR